MRYIIPVCALLFMLACCGCEEEQMQTVSSDSPSAKIQASCLFVPEKIRFNQLTEFADDQQISAYVDMLDQFGSRIKAGAVWRFELYEYVLRSAEPRGKRLYIWPDIKLTNAEKNYALWQDYLRCYKFDLDFDIDLMNNTTYILQAICFTAEGRRIIEFTELKR